MNTSTFEKCSVLCKHLSNESHSNNSGSKEGEPLCRDSEHCLETLAKDRRAYLREDVSTPTLFIGMGTCGLGAGAAKTLNAIKTYVREKNVECQLVEVGCIGLCSEEPIMDVQLPGSKRLSFSKVDEKKVKTILDAVFSGCEEIPGAIFQFGDQKLRSWKNVPLMNEHQFFIYHKAFFYFIFKRINNLYWIFQINCI